MLKIVGPIALAIITISASTDETTNGLQRRLLGDDDKYKPNVDIWNGDYSKDKKKDDNDYKADYPKNNNKKDDNNGDYDNDKNDKYIDDNHRYPQFKSYYQRPDHDYNDKTKGWNTNYKPSDYKPDYKPYDNDNKKGWDTGYSSNYKPGDYDYDYNKKMDDKKKGWNSGYGANYMSKSGDYKPYENDRQNKWNNDYKPEKHYGDDKQHENKKSGWDNDKQKGWNADHSPNKPWGAEYYGDKQDYNKKGGWNSNKGWGNHYETDKYYGHNEYDNDKNKGWNSNYKYGDKDKSVYPSYNSNSAGQYYTRPSSWDKQKGWNSNYYKHGDEYAPYKSNSASGWDNDKQKGWSSNYNNYGYQYPSYNSNSGDYYSRSSGWDNDNGHSTDPMYVKEAIVILNVGDGSGVDGFIKFEDIDHGKKTKISAKITGLKPNKKHGWHIHQFGDIFTDGCASAGPHYNPFMKNHGAPDDKIRHIGDLGNIYADKDGVAYIDAQYDEMVKLNGPNSIIGRGFVIHADEDDLGRGGNDESLKTGNAGDRIACGVIGIKKED